MGQRFVPKSFLKRTITKLQRSERLGRNTPHNEGVAFEAGDPRKLWLPVRRPFRRRLRGRGFRRGRMLFRESRGALADQRRAPVCRLSGYTRMISMGRPRDASS